ncbi:MAG: LemA family protein [Acidobacteriota bacterium]|nr:LemA family protein [Acidobacteriota bacterium]
MSSKAFLFLGCGAFVMIGLVVGFLMMVGGHNQLITHQQNVGAAWAQVQNAYQRRADLVPNLVATVKGAADFQSETLQAVVDARSRVGNIQIEGAPTEQMLESFEAAQGELSSALSRLLVVVENYPELTATENFRDLQSQLEGTENRISVERRRFNEAVREYNTLRGKIPMNLIANVMGFEEKPYFAADAGAEKAPEVQF